MSDPRLGVPRREQAECPLVRRCTPPAPEQPALQAKGCRMRLPSRRFTALLVTLTLAGTLPACGSTPAPDATLRAFLAGWHQGQLSDKVAMLGPDGQPLPTAQAQTQLAALAGDLAAKWPTLTVAGKPKVVKREANANVTVVWPVTDKVNWQYTTSVRLHRASDKWQVRFGPKTVHPELTDGAKLAVRSESAPRGDILDASGQALLTGRPVINVGVRRDLVTDLNGLVKTLGSAFTSIGVDIDLSDLPARVNSAAPDAFVDVVTLRRTDYDKISAKIKDLNGTVF